MGLLLGGKDNRTLTPSEFRGTGLKEAVFPLFLERWEVAGCRWHLPHNGIGESRMETVQWCIRTEGALLTVRVSCRIREVEEGNHISTALLSSVLDIMEREGRSRCKEHLWRKNQFFYVDLTKGTARRGHETEGRWGHAPLQLPAWSGPLPSTLHCNVAQPVCSHMPTQGGGQGGIDYLSLSPKLLKWLHLLGNDQVKVSAIRLNEMWNTLPTIGRWLFL